MHVRGVCRSLAAGVFFFGFALLAPSGALAQDAGHECRDAGSTAAVESAASDCLSAVSRADTGVAVTWNNYGREHSSHLTHPALTGVLADSGIPQLTGDDVYIREGGATLALFERQLGRDRWLSTFYPPGPNHGRGYREFKTLYFGARDRLEDLALRAGGAPHDDLVRRVDINASYVRSEDQRPQALVAHADFCVVNGNVLDMRPPLEDATRCEGRRVRAISVHSLEFVDSTGRFRSREIASVLIINDPDGIEHVYRGTVAQISRQLPR